MWEVRKRCSFFGQGLRFMSLKEWRIVGRIVLFLRRPVGHEGLYAFDICKITNIK